MAISVHRKSPNRARELRERVWALVETRLGTRTICGRCGASIVTFADKCSADLDEKCPGFEAIEAARAIAKQQMGLA